MACGKRLYGEEASGKGRAPAAQDRLRAGGHSVAGVVCTALRILFGGAGNAA